MFRHIFPDKLNRLVYQKATPKASEAAEAIKAAEKAKVTPKQLREEAAARENAVDDFLKSWEIRLNIGQGYKLKLSYSDPKKVDSRLSSGDAKMWANLVRIRNEYKELSRSGRVSRGAIDKVSGDMRIAMARYEMQRKKGDPLCDATMSRVAKAQPKPKSRAEKAVARVEAREVSRWSKMARLIEEHADLEPLSPARRARMKKENPQKLARMEAANNARRKVVAKQLIAMAQDLLPMGKSVVAKEGVTIRNKPGSREYSFTLNKTSRLRGSAARAWSRTVKVRA